MVIWFVIALIFIGAAYWLFKNMRNAWDEDLFLFGGVIASILGILFFLIPTFCHLDYIEFEKQFEIQREQFEKMIENEVIKENNYLYVIDVLNSNKELAVYQSSKQLWGVFSNIPKRVFDIKPIGIE